MEENTSIDISAVNEKIAQESAFIDLLMLEMNKVIVGQKYMVERLLIGLLGNGHILLEGVPGLAKTLAINTLASIVDADFSRIQFTPDLLPADLIGTMIYSQKKEEFLVKKGPIFTNFVLADEINRSPAKVQSALLEAMQERQVTIGGTTFRFDEPFLVLATQNPIEHEGTYPLPEAQLDRFLLHVVLDYPSAEDELVILQKDREQHYGEDKETMSSPLHPETVLTARREVAEIHVDEMLEKYIVALVGATRHISDLNHDWDDFLIAGASPRASIALLRAASATAYLRGRDHVIPEDVKALYLPVCAHRLILRPENEALDRKEILLSLLDENPVPLV